jgi:hypothetical protein
MHYLVWSPSEYDYDDVGDVTDITPLIPAFNIEGVDCNYFLGADSYGKVRHAKIAELNRDPDELLEKIVATYPGIPPAMLERYLVSSCVAAGNLSKNYKYQCVLSGNKVALRTLDVELDDYVLWEDLDPKDYM